MHYFLQSASFPPLSPLVCLAQLSPLRHLSLCHGFGTRLSTRLTHAEERLAAFDDSPLRERRIFRPSPPRCFILDTRTSERVLQHFCLNTPHAGPTHSKVCVAASLQASTLKLTMTRPIQRALQENDVENIDPYRIDRAPPTITDAAALHIHSTLVHSDTGAESKVGRSEPPPYVNLCLHVRRQILRVLHPCRSPTTPHTAPTTPSR